MEKTIDKTPQLLLKGRDLAGYYQTGRNLALCNINNTLESTARKIITLRSVLEEIAHAPSQLEEPDTIMQTITSFSNS